MSIGQKIKKLRELRNLTQLHMAERLNLTQSAYSKLELGDNDISFSKLEKIAEVLEMKPEEIISFNEAMIFNVMHNEVGNGYVVYNTSETEKKLYEGQITILKDEVTYLKTVIEQLLKK